MKLNRELFLEQRHPRFGTANPQRLRLAYWEWMVRQKHTPHTMRQQFETDPDEQTGPDWCFYRMGATRTKLSDGRIICVGGEHEDWYDPDFYIYNDVVILGPDDGVEIYGYPKEVFPPTDFHTATLIGNQIIVIGGLGYESDRIPGFTPVYSLDSTTRQIKQITTQGESPGWIFDHKAEFDPVQGVIIVQGGQTFERKGEESFLRKNVEEYGFIVKEKRWQRLSDRQNWRQFLIRYKDKPPRRPRHMPEEEVFQLPYAPHEFLPYPDWRTYRIVVERVSIDIISENWMKERILFYGELPDDIVQTVVKDILLSLEQWKKQSGEVMEI